MYSTNNQIKENRYIVKITKEYLYENYIVLDKSMASIAKELGITESKVWYWVHKYELDYKSTDIDKVFQLKHIDNSDPIFCYFAGLLATDGYFDYKNSRVSLRVNNEGSKEVFEAIREYIDYIRPIRSYGKGNRLLYDITIPNKCIFSELAKMGISGLKDTRTFNLDWFNQASRECQLMFLRGVHDGDGNFHNKAFRLSMKSESFVVNLIKAINNILDSNYVLRYTSNSSKNKYPNVTLHVDDTNRLFKLIYDGFEEFKFSDKYNKFLTFMR